MDEETKRELSTAADMAGLQMEFLELLRDAERYRWLRKEQEKEPSVIYCCWPGDLGEKLDAAIDAAMAAGAA